MKHTTPDEVSTHPEINRVLVYRMGSLGDTVVALPSLHLIARAFPNAERRMLTNFPVSVKAPAAAAILADNGLIHGYFRYAAGTRSPKELLALWWTLLRWRPQVLVYLGPVRGVAAAERDAKFFRLCGISWQIGVPLTESMQKHGLRLETGDLEPECERLARNLSELGDARPGSEAAWDLGLTAAEFHRAAEVLKAVEDRPILAVSVGTKVQSKDWGRENWRGLLERLGAAFPGHALALTGVKEESEASEYAADGWRAAAGPASAVVNLCGLLTPRESAACFRRARLFLGHDSGPMHLAATVGTPCVAIFAARNIPRMWFPYGDGHRVLYHKVDCMGCGLETCIEQRKKCLTSITVDEVADAVAASLAESSSRDGHAPATN
jgi:ADP-heptose:LPS heptosyltransferase